MDSGKIILMASNCTSDKTMIGYHWASIRCVNHLTTSDSQVVYTFLSERGFGRLLIRTEDKVYPVFIEKQIRPRRKHLDSP
ncbi:hypothetical protein J6590_067184 [Homalodisca vitripennis]|nr:hypothetical protein J6590_067184 [Homalodisca vitripennis]